MKTFKEYLNEGHKFSCVMLELTDKQLVNEWQADVSSINKLDFYPDEEMVNYPHITLLYGLNDDSYDDVFNIMMNFNSITTISNSVNAFYNDKFDVLKYQFDDIRLTEMNKSLKQLPHVTTYREYSPHMTLGYLRKNTVDKYLNYNDWNLLSKPLTFNTIMFSTTNDQIFRFQLI